MNEKDTYYVAVKMFLEDGNKLLILQDGFKEWDLPGGRLKKGEFGVPLEQVLARKMSEELGNDVKYELGSPVVHMRHERTEAIEGNPTVRIFAVGYRAKYVGGEIQLPSHHTQYVWVDKSTFEPEKFFSGGWLKGVQEYLALT